MSGLQTDLMDAIGHHSWRKAADLLATKTIRTVNKKDISGNTALHYLCFRTIESGGEKSAIEIAKKLVELGANVNETNNDGDTPLMLAIRNASFGVAATLLNVEEINV